MPSPGSSSPRFLAAEIVRALLCAALVAMPYSALCDDEIHFNNLSGQPAAVLVMDDEGKPQKSGEIIVQPGQALRLDNGKGKSLVRINGAVTRVEEVGRKDGDRYLIEYAPRPALQTQLIAPAVEARRPVLVPAPVVAPPIAPPQPPPGVVVARSAGNQYAQFTEQLRARLQVAGEINDGTEGGKSGLSNWFYENYTTPDQVVIYPNPHDPSSGEIVYPYSSRVITRQFASGTEVRANETRGRNILRANYQLNPRGIVTITDVNFDAPPERRTGETLLIKLEGVNGSHPASMPY